MSTPHEYDPQKANAWTRDLPKPPPSPWAGFEMTENPYALPAQDRARFDSIVSRISKLHYAARAVIAAGRPNERGHARIGCDCDACTAYDALKTLLEP